MTGRWSNLPLDLLEVIESHLTLFIDKLRIRAVCESWRSHLSKIPDDKAKRFPRLLQVLEGETEGSHGLFSPIDEKIYEIDFSEAKGKIFKGSSYGWVVTVEDVDYSSSPADINLINPLTNARIKLPPRNKFPDVKTYRPEKVYKEYVLRSDGPDSQRRLQVVNSHFVNGFLTSKVVLSSSPCDENCMAVAIYGHNLRLAYCKCTDKKWKPLNVGKSGIQVYDVIFHEGKLHAVNWEGQVLVFENIGIGTEAKVTIFETRELKYEPREIETFYLVKCTDGGLMMVRRFFDVERKSEVIGGPVTTTNRFKFKVKVYKLDTTNSRFVKVHDIGNDILFLDISSSMTISSDDLPGYRGNRIYFMDLLYRTDDMNAVEEQDSYLGVFDLQDRTTQELSCFKFDPDFPPLWIKID